MKKIKLFCLPYAGGSATLYARWKKLLHSSIELVPVELAGRGKKYNIPFYDGFNAAVIDIYDAVRSEAGDEPYALFGHSMGCLLVYELFFKMIDNNYREPEHIFFSGRYPPHIKKEEKIHYTMPDDKFLEEIIKYGGTPKEILEHKELLNIFIPILKADYRILDDYTFAGRTDKFNFDITVLTGTQDDEVEMNDLEEWSKYTKKGYRYHQFEGGHFFINQYAEDITDIINKTLVPENDTKLMDMYSVLFE